MRLESSGSDEHRADSRLRSPLLNRFRQPVDSEVAATADPRNLPRFAANVGNSRKSIVGLSALVLLATTVAVAVPMIQRHYGGQVSSPKKANAIIVGSAGGEIDRLFHLSANPEKPVQDFGLTADELRTKLQAALPKHESPAVEKTRPVIVKQAPPVEAPSEEAESTQEVKTVELPPAKTPEAPAVSVKSATNPVAVKTLPAAPKETLVESEGTVSTSAWLEPSVGEGGATAGSAASGSTKAGNSSKKSGTASDGALVPEVSTTDASPKKVASALPKPATKVAISDMAEYNRLLASYFSKRQEESKSSASQAASEHPPTYDEWLSSKKQIF